MKLENLLTNLKAGNYEIKTEYDCGCNGHWKIENEELVPDIYSDACWIGNVLYVNDEMIFQNLAHEEIEILDEELLKEVGYQFNLGDWLLENDIYDISAEFGFDDETPNPSHEETMRLTLVNLVEDYDCYINYPRNFSNEYTCILVDRDAIFDEEDKELLEVSDKVTPEKFAEKYLNKNDAATEYYIGFKLIL